MVEPEAVVPEGANLTGRLEVIDDWWSKGFLGAFAVGGRRTEERVRKTFRKVLQAMPTAEFDRFMALDPTIVCQPSPTLRGLTYQYFVPTPPGHDGATLTVINLAPVVATMSMHGLGNLIAHECAHVVLEHWDGHPEPAEVAADALAVKWGFEGSYRKNRNGRRCAQTKRPIETTRKTRLPRRAR